MSPSLPGRRNFLTKFKMGGNVSLNYLVMGVETLVQGQTPQSKQVSISWHANEKIL